MMINREESLRGAIEVSKNRDLVIDLDLPMDIYITENYRKRLSQAYSQAIAKKILNDSMGALKLTNPDYSDVCSHLPYYDDRKIINYEIKTSFLREKTNNFRLTHIRPWQEFDYFIVCFIDKIDDFRGHFYIVPKKFICDNPNFNLHVMLGTKKANMKNENKEMAVNIKREDALYLFESESIVNGTSYDDLMEFIRGYGAHKINLNKKIKKQTKISFEFNGNIIRGHTNMETITELANHLGPLLVKDYFSPHWLSKEETKLRNVKLKLGNNFLNPKISLRDIRYIINRGNRKTRLKIRIIEE